MRVLGLLALACVCVFPHAGWAADCKPLNIVSSLEMTALDASGVSTIPITVNGVEKRFVLDTGGTFAQISPNTADALELPRQDSNIDLYAVDGSVSHSSVRVQDFVLGTLHGGGIVLQVSPMGVGDDFDGIFSPVPFIAYDFEMNFAAHKLNILSNDHCEGKVIYWPAQALAVVPISIKGLHVTVPVKLDGKDFAAIIDTGASDTVIRQDAALSAFGLRPGSPDMTADGHIGKDENAVRYRYPFKTLTFEGVTVGNPKVRILPNVMNRNADQSHKMNTNIGRNSDDVALPEAIVGMDVLSKLHLYFAFKERKLYITEAAGN